MGKSIADVHKKNVGLLKERGEEVKQPLFGRPHNSVRGYVKHLVDDGEMYFGAILNNEDGSYAVMFGMARGEVSPLSLDDIGLCDSKLEYDYHVDKEKVIKYLLEGDAGPQIVGLQIKELRKELDNAKKAVIGLRKTIENAEEWLDFIEKHVK